MRPTLKLYLTSLKIALTILPTAAQTTNQDRDQQDLHRNYILSVLKEQTTAHTAEKPTGTKQRVKAQTQTNSNLWDSTSYHYSGNKGSRFNYNNFTYNESLNIGWSPAEIMPNWTMPSDLLADTVVQIENNQITSRDYGIYRSDNQLNFIQSELGAWAFPNDRYRQAITYDAANRPITHYYSSYSSTTPADTTSLRRFYYKSNGKIDLDSSWIKENGIWAFESTTQYHYDGGNARTVDSMFSISSSILSPGRVTTYAYYPDGKLETMKSVVYNAGVPVQILNDSLGYTFNVTYATYWEHKFISAVTENTISRQIEIFHPNATTSLPDSARWIIISSSSQTERIYRYEYNSFANPEKITVYNTTSPTSNPDNIYRFYYETYDDGVSINEVKREDDLFVYPNPFINEITISCNPATKNLRVLIFNVLGLQVFNDDCISRQGKTTFHLPNLPKGYYTMMLQSGKEKTWFKKLVRK